MTDHNHNRKCHQFLLMWCCEGLEYVGDITEDSQKAVWAALQGESYRSSIPNLMHLELRARYNSQRFYEIYVVEVEEGITADDLKELFASAPQEAAEMIRERGTRVFGEPMLKQRAVIT